MPMVFSNPRNHLPFFACNFGKVFQDLRFRVIHFQSFKSGNPYQPPAVSKYLVDPKIVSLSRHRRHLVNRPVLQVHACYTHRTNNQRIVGQKAKRINQVVGQVRIGSRVGFHFTSLRMKALHPCIQIPNPQITFPVFHQVPDIVTRQAIRHGIPDCLSLIQTIQSAIESASP